MITTLFKRLFASADRAATSLWRACFAIVGKYSRSIPVAMATGDNHVLVLAPHPDDEVAGCCGAVMAHLRAGDTVSVLVVTDGRQSRALGLAENEMVERRLHESIAAERALGTGFRRLQLHEGNWDSITLRQSLPEILKAEQPDIIYAPCWLDFHPEHRKVAACLADHVEGGARVRIVSLHVPLGDLVNTVVAVGPYMPEIERLFLVYETQSASLLRGLRMRRYAAARYGIANGAEEFLQVNGEDYRRVHHRLKHRPRVRGLRYWSFTDPLSYLLGWRDRRKFKRALLS